MQIAVLGTGMVGQAIASKLVSLGHEVAMGSRSADNEAAVAWVAGAGDRAGQATFADAAAGAELVFNCTAGTASLDVLEAAGAENLAGKVLIDVANPLDFSHGTPPTLALANTDSLGEQLQRTFPAVRVVKALNTINCQVMVDPSRVPGEHNVFICGDDRDAKRQVSELLRSFGWPAMAVIDLGGIAAARATEMYLPLWLHLYQTLKTGDFNVRVMR